MSQRNRFKKRQRNKKEEKTSLDPTQLIKGVKVTNDKLGQTREEYVSLALKEADTLWNKLRKMVQEQPGFVKLPDQDKIELFMKDHKTFQNEFPIVCRYMICMGQYKEKAFEKYLNKVKNFKIKENREKGYMEEIWIDRQADYVKYLWEEYQKQARTKYTQHEARKVWKAARESIKTEFDQFRGKHKEAEEKINKEKVQNKQELTKELVERIKLGKQKLSDEDMQKLIEQAKVRLFIQRKDKTMAELTKAKKQIKPSRESWGKIKEPMKGKKSSMT